MRDLNNLNKEHDNKLKGEMAMEEKRTKRITDVEVYNAIEAVKNDEEGSIGKALEALLAVTVDTRVFLRKLYKEVVPAKERTNYEEKK